MSGAPDPLYVAARRVLLDALTALGAHLDSIVLVGAQAVYVHAGEADLAVAPFTTDGDLAIDPRQLAHRPLLEVVLAGAGFRVAADAVGIWEMPVVIAGISSSVALDLLVPESLGGGGRRGARIPPHAQNVARKVSGLEAAMVDHESHTIGALDPTDDRRVQLAVAGPAALIVAKVHKILDRAGASHRRNDKDALDIYRLLKAVPTEALQGQFMVVLRNDLSRAVAERTMAELPRLFASTDSLGSQMAVRAAGPLEPSETLVASLVALAQDLSASLGR